MTPKKLKHQSKLRCPKCKYQPKKELDPGSTPSSTYRTCESCGKTNAWAMWSEVL